MKKIYFATSNQGKVKNAQEALEPLGYEIEQVAIELAESRSEDPAEIVLEKAKQAYAILGKPVMVEDSGFFIRALGGFPMTHIKFSLKSLGIKNIMKMMIGVPDRHAEWRMSVAYAWSKTKTQVVTFVEEGRLSEDLRPKVRDVMSDYWFVYIPTALKGNTRALSEMSDQTLAQWKEHYAKNNQFAKLGEWLRDFGRT